MIRQFSLKYKLVLLILPLFFLYSLAQYFLFQETILESFRKIETDDSHRYANQVAAALNRELVALDAYTLDWATWDDTYEFAATGLPSYIDNNLYNDYLVTSDIQLFAVLNSAGDLVYGRGFDDETGESYDLATLGISRNQLQVLYPRGNRKAEFEKSGAKGYLNTKRGLLYFSARSIFTSNSKGPSTGALIIGRLLHEERQLQIQQQTGVSFRLLTQAEILDDHEKTTILAQLPLASQRTTTESDTELRLYERVDDAVGELLFLIEVPYPRRIISEGVRTTQISLVQSVIVGVIILAGIWIGTRIIIVSPLEKLIAHLAQMRTTQDYLNRLTMNRNDEIGTLTSGYNRLLDRISSQTTKLESLNDELIQISNTDSLTQISNRRSFDAQFHKEVGSLRRKIRQSTPAGSLSLLICDIDFFKQYNDTYGHSAGDECLQRVAQVIDSCGSRPSDFAAGYGGEEFAILLPETPEEGALRLADRVREAIVALNIEHRSSEIAHHLTVSIGIATLHATDEAVADQLFSQADSALYQAKQQGRNRVKIFRKPS